MFLDEVHYQIFYNMLPESEFKLVVIVENDCIISNLFVASVNKTIRLLNRRVKLEFINRKKDYYNKEYDLVFPRLLIFKNDKLINTIYGFKNSKKLLLELNKKIK